MSLCFKPRLRFSPTAWTKLLFLRDWGQTEIGAFAISSLEEPLLVEDVALVRQLCSPISVVFDDAAVADFFDRQVDLGRIPAQFARIWIHTHPGACPRPSVTDEETFERVFGRSDWAVMFILARHGATYCRLRFAAGPAGEFEIGADIDHQRSFPATDFEAWREEYRASVRPELIDVREMTRWPEALDGYAPTWFDAPNQEFDRLTWEGFSHDDWGELFEDRR